MFKRNLRYRNKNGSGAFDIIVRAIYHQNAERAKLKVSFVSKVCDSDKIASLPLNLKSSGLWWTEHKVKLSPDMWYQVYGKLEK